MKIYVFGSPAKTMNISLTLAPHYTDLVLCTGRGKARAVTKPEHVEYYHQELARGKVFMRKKLEDYSSDEWECLEKVAECFLRKCK
jgi:hypothetical protein